MKYLITYDLNRPGQDYEDLINAIKVYENIHVMQSVWFISTDEKAEEIYQYFKNYLDKNDNIFICEINSNRQGYLNKKYWEFLKL